MMDQWDDFRRRRAYIDKNGIMRMEDDARTIGELREELAKARACARVWKAAAKMWRNRMHSVNWAIKQYKWMD